MVHGGGNLARGVFAVEERGELAGAVQIAKAPVRHLFPDFVARAPEDHARVVAVSMHKVDDVALVPGLIIKVVIVGSLTQLPAVKQLVHHHKAHAIAEIEQLRRGRVVGGADGVAAHRLEDFQLALSGPLVECRSERAEVVMIAYALDFHHAVVEQKPLLCTPFDLADAKGRFDAVHFPSVGEQCCPQRVQYR